jgi:hypothetical protein
MDRRVADRGMIARASLRTCYLHQADMDAVTSRAVLSRDSRRPLSHSDAQEKEQHYKHGQKDFVHSTTPVNLDTPILYRSDAAHVKSFLNNTCTRRTRESSIPVCRVAIQRFSGTRYAGNPGIRLKWHPTCTETAWTARYRRMRATLWMLSGIRRLIQGLITADNPPARVLLLGLNGDCLIR